MGARLEVTAWLPRAILFLVFSIAVVGKVGRRPAFRGTLASLELLPGELLGSITWLILGLESLVALSALFGIMPLGVALSVVLTAGFIAVSARATLRGDIVMCNCFGPTAAPLGISTIARSLLLLMVAGIWVLQATGHLGLPINSLSDAVWAATIVAGSVLLGRWVTEATVAMELVVGRTHR